MRVVGIDPALGGTGLADDDGRTYRIEEKRGDAYDRTRQAVGRIIGLLPVLPTLVVLEAYAGGSPGRISTIRSIEFGGYLRIALRQNGYAFVDVAPSTLKAYATGTGRAEKADMISAVADRIAMYGIDLTDDEADALWLRDVGLWALGEPAAGPHHRIEPTVRLALAERMRIGLGAAGLSPREDG